MSTPNHRRHFGALGATPLLTLMPLAADHPSGVVGCATLNVADLTGETKAMAAASRANEVCCF
jgi:hypothetical protein